MNGVVRGSQSSQCHWSSAPERGLKAAASLEPVHKIAIITPDPHVVPQLGTQREATLAQILDAGTPLALSYPRNDTHTVVLVRNGKVWLRLSAESYYRAGLEATKHGRRYLAIYDTKKPGKRLDRFKWALQNTLTATFTFHVSTSDPTGETRAHTTDLFVPPLEPPEDNEGFSDWANEFTEWAGLAAVAPQMLTGTRTVDRAISDNYVPENAVLQKANVSLTSGVYTAEQIQALWATLHTQPWAVMSVQGFEYAPIAQRSEKVRESGEQGFTLIARDSTTSIIRYTH